MKYQFKTFVNTDTEGPHIIIGLVETKVLNKVGSAYPLFKKLYVTTTYTIHGWSGSYIQPKA